MSIPNLETTLKQLRLSGLAGTLSLRLQEAAANRLAHEEFLEILLQGQWTVLAEARTAQDSIGQVGALGAAPDGSVYVLDWSENKPRVRRLDPQGRWTVIASQGTELGQITYASDLTADATGKLYVVDAGRVMVRDADGKWYLIAGEDSGTSGPSRPSSITVDGHGVVFVIDGALSRLLRWTPRAKVHASAPVTDKKEGRR